MSLSLRGQGCSGVLSGPGSSVKTVLFPGPEQVIIYFCVFITVYLKASSVVYLGTKKCSYFILQITLCNAKQPT